MYQILMIEDDPKLQDLIQDYLEKYNYAVKRINDFKNVENELTHSNADLIILDINLPYYDGFYLCRLIRKSSTIPIIIISARSGDAEQVMGIELGADDYITKPFSRDVLLAKVKAALRRAYGEYQHRETTKKEHNSPLLLDRDSFKLKYKTKELDLTKNEYRLLKLLLENKDKIVKREEILTELWDDSSFVDDNTLTVNVTRVKHKFEELGLKEAIKTKRGVGYFFDSSMLEESGHE